MCMDFKDPLVPDMTVAGFSNPACTAAAPQDLRPALPQQSTGGCWQMRTHKVRFDLLAPECLPTFVNITLSGNQHCAMQIVYAGLLLVPA